MVYPGTGFANNLKQIAQLLKANLGVEAAFADIGDWDTHQAQGSTQGRLANRLKEFSEAIAAFWKDMGQDAEHITLVTMSEFGRTARQNGTGGTDHGHGNVMFVLGGTHQGRQGLRPLARAGRSAVERRARPGGYHRFSAGAGRSDLPVPWARGT